MPTPAGQTERDALNVAFAAARSVSDRHRARLMKYPNVIDVRAGYKFRDGWITSIPAVVVTVLQKHPEAHGDDALPAELDGVPVDVTPATPQQQLRSMAMNKKDWPARSGRPGCPPFPPSNRSWNRRSPARSFLRAIGSRNGRRTGLQGTSQTETACGYGTDVPAVSRQSRRWVAKPSPVPERRAQDADGRHVRLRGGLYFRDGLQGNERCRRALCAQPGQEVKSAARRRDDGGGGRKWLREGSRAKFEYATAAVGTLFPNAYHIKVAVRDASSLWLSSGNWQESNQPETDALNLSEAEKRQLLSTHNREWHVICDSAKLAKIFEEYIKFDMSEAKRVAGARAPVAPAPAELPDLIVPLEKDMESRAAKAVKIFVRRSSHSRPPLPSRCNRS